MLEISDGIWLIKPSEDSSIAFADNSFYVHPQNTGNLVKFDDTYLYFAGGAENDF